MFLERSCQDTQIGVKAEEVLDYKIIPSSWP